MNHHTVWRRALPALLTFLLLLGSAQAGDSLQVPERPVDFKYWHNHPSTFTQVRATAPGYEQVLLDVPADYPTDWYQAFYRYYARAGRQYEFQVEGRLEDFAGEGHGLIVSLGFWSADGERIGHDDFYYKPVPEGWQPATVRAVAPEGTVSFTLSVLLHGQGRAWFRKPRLLVGEPSPPPVPAEEVVLRVTDEVAVPALTGFGAEDDGWFYNEHNRREGADEEAYRIREERIRWMDPDWVRMFFWHADWRPRPGTPEHYTFDSDNMQSHYRTLELYQELGAAVTVCQVEWTFEDYWEDPDAFARATGDLMEHLIREKGFDCIRYWTLTNEPNLHFYYFQPWERYIELHEKVVAEFERRGLELKVMGSDDGEGLAWLRACAAEPRLSGLIDTYVSHAYWRQYQLPCIPDGFADRLAWLGEHDPGKPFVMAEFGFFDERSVPPDRNPLMREYGYAMNMMTTAIDGLNLGVAGFSIWCMHRMFYPGGERAMQFGLWEWADRDWAVRPVYHAVALWTRYTERGETVYRVASSAPELARATATGRALFWVNPNDFAQPLRVEGFEGGQLRIVTEASLRGDREVGRVLEASDGRFTAPPRSFGVLTRAGR